jgi:hypothetical protein
MGLALANESRICPAPKTSLAQKWQGGAEKYTPVLGSESCQESRIKILAIGFRSELMKRGCSWSTDLLQKLGGRTKQR